MSNPFDKVKSAPVAKKLLGYRLRSGCSSYVFRDGSIASAVGGIITNWKPEHKAEIDENVAANCMFEVYDSAEVKASVMEIQKAADSMVVGEVISSAEQSN